MNAETRRPLLLAIAAASVLTVGALEISTVAASPCDLGTSKACTVSSSRRSKRVRIIATSIGKAFASTLLAAVLACLCCLVKCANTACLSFAGDF
jgi:hypothetical protein